MRKLYLALFSALVLLMTGLLTGFSSGNTQQESHYIGPFTIPAEWRSDSTIRTLLFNLYQPLALSNISSPEGHQNKSQYLAFYFCHPVFTPRQCFDNNDPIGNAVVMLRIKPLATPPESTPFDGNTVEFSEELVVWFPNTPEGSTSCVSMTKWGGLPFLALTRRGLVSLREQLAIDEQSLRVITTIDGSRWLPDATEAAEDNFTWRCKRLK